MILNEKLREVMSSETFKSYKDKNPDCFLASFFSMTSPNEDYKWQIDFYSENSEKMTSFILGEEVHIKESDKVFKPKDSKIYPLDINKVKVELKDTLSKADSALKNKNPDEGVNKVILILQNIGGKEVWNITYVTNAFNILNIKINAVTGEKESESYESILSFKIPAKK